MAFALFAAALGTLWALASPLAGVPDEQSHVTYAWGMASGDAWTSDIEAPDVATVAGAGQVPLLDVRVPEALQAAIDPACYASDNRVPAADCNNRLEGASSRREVEVPTRMVRYPPAYYVPAGLVMRAGLAAGLDGPATWLLTRIASALAVAALVVVALCLLLRRLPVLAATAGAVLLLPPTAVFVGAGVNPSGLEVAGTALLATAVLGVRLDLAQRGAVRRDVLVVLCATAPAVALVRPLSVAWLVVVGLGLLVPLRLRDPDGWSVPVARLPWWTVTVGASSVAAGAAWLAWSAAGRGVTTTDTITQAWAAVPVHEQVALVALRTTGMMLDLVGNFGWLDTPLPAGVSGAWLVAVVAVAVLALALDRSPAPRPWHVAAVVLVAGTGVVIGHQMLSGLGWQPRYVLPVLCAAFALLLGSSVGWGDEHRVVLAAAALTGVAVHVFSVLWTFARFRWGYSQPSFRFPATPLPGTVDDPAAWVPVVGPSSLLLLALATAAVGTVAVLLALVATRCPVAGREDEVAAGLTGPAAAPPAGTARTRSSGWPRPARAARRR